MYVVLYVKMSLVRNRLLGNSCIKLFTMKQLFYQALLDKGNSGIRLSSSKATLG
jgi:hypothetical protein